MRKTPRLSVGFGSRHPIRVILRGRGGESTGPFSFNVWKRLFTFRRKPRLLGVRSLPPAFPSTDFPQILSHRPGKWVGRTASGPDTGVFLPTPRRRLLSSRAGVQAPRCQGSVLTSAGFFHGWLLLCRCSHSSDASGPQLFSQ